MPDPNAKEPTCANCGCRLADAFRAELEHHAEGCPQAPVGYMSEARSGAAKRLVDILAPAAALGIKCEFCTAKPGILCHSKDIFGTGVRPDSPHEARLAAARSELHALLLTLGLPHGAHRRVLRSVRAPICQGAESSMSR